MFLTLGIFLVALVTPGWGNISGTNPPNGACLCLTHTGVRVRNAACGATVIGTTNSPKCYKYKGSKNRCTLSGTSYEFFKVNFGGRDGWMAGNFMNRASDTRCGSGTRPPTAIGGYRCRIADRGRRIHESPGRTPYDCKSTSCGNTCRGGQCVAYVTCRCTKPGTGNHPPSTRCWRAGARVVVNGRCNPSIPSGTAIATFNSAGRYYAGHAAVFVSCADATTVRAYDQGCCSSIGYTNYRNTHPHYKNFRVLTNPGVCADRKTWNCRSQAAGPTCCPVVASGCRKRLYWYDQYGLDEEES